MSDLSPQAQRIMQLTREALSPDESAVAALRAVLDARLGPVHAPTAPASSAAAHGTTAITKGALLKLAAGALLVGTIVFGVVVFGFRAVHRSEPRAAKALPSQVAARPALIVEPVDSLVPKLAPDVPSAPTSPVRSVGDPATRAARSSRPAQRAAHDAARSGRVTQPSSARAKHSELPAKAPEADDSLAPELALLREARTALDRHDPQTALSLLDRHAQRYPAGTLQQEQLAARARALCALGRAAEAAATARELARVAPGSPYLASVRAACGAETISPAR
jgi:hypothetical protein